jgi:hypothetical protein
LKQWRRARDHAQSAYRCENGVAAVFAVCIAACNPTVVKGRDYCWSRRLQLHHNSIGPKRTNVLDKGHGTTHSQPTGVTVTGSTAIFERCPSRPNWPTSRAVVAADRQHCLQCQLRKQKQSHAAGLGRLLIPFCIPTATCAPAFSHGTHHNINYPVM